MPPFSNQNSSPERPEDDDAAIISPLKVHPAGAADGRSMRRWTRPALLVVCLATLMVSGIWLIRYVGGNQAPPPVRSHKETTRISAGADQPVPAPGSSVRPAVNSAEEEPGTPAAPPMPEATENQTVSANVLALMDRGRQHERQKEFRLAQDAYREAYDTGHQYQPAAIALKRVSDQIAEEEYRQILAAGIDALEKGDYDRARNELMRAKSLKPEAGEAGRALAKLERTMRRNRIDALEQMGRNAEIAEDWQAAQKHYASILAIAPDHPSARQGVDRAQQQFRVMAEMEFLLGRPDTLFKKAGLDKALATLREARALDPRGPQLERRLGRFERLVAEMQKPVRVTIRSDNQTHVDVYKIGRLGPFFEKMLDLKPGVYVVVGHREGYRDVRHEIIVRPGGQAQRVTVICKVKV